MLWRFFISYKNNRLSKKVLFLSIIFLLKFFSMDILKRCVFLLCLLVGGSSLAQTPDAYTQSVNQWHKEREAGLKRENGWLNLVGLYWLSPGKNTFGTAKNNNVVFPKGSVEEYAGYFELGADNTVTVVPAEYVAIKVNGAPVTRAIIFHNDSTRVPTTSYKNLRWTVIRRNDKIGIRLRDLQSAALTAFNGIERYPVSAAWKVNALLEKTGTPDRIDITNVLGQTSQQKAAGRLSFSIGGKHYSLDALDEGGPDLFVVFADQTNVSETYPSGRFLSVNRPDANGNTVIDFNKSYNPPCAFTDYATCPLPPPQNRLSIAVPAGEKKWGHH